jgi:hypothetical protein
MKNDSISASSKIKELFDLRKSGILNDEEYHNQLKSWILSYLKSKPLKELNTEKESVKVSKEDARTSSGEFKKSEYDLIKSDIIDKDDGQHIKVRVEKVLWTLLN